MIEIIAYLIVCLATSSLMMAFFHHKVTFDSDDDRIGITAVACLCGLFWPLIIPMVFVYYSGKVLEARAFN
jgi:hypothetical protein